MGNLLIQFAVKKAARVVIFTSRGGIGFPASLVLGAGILAIGTIAAGAYKLGELINS